LHGILGLRKRQAYLLFRLLLFSFCPYLKDTRIGAPYQRIFFSVH
jgi:hypothetical protein